MQTVQALKHPLACFPKRSFSESRQAGFLLLLRRVFHRVCVFAEGL